MHWQHQWGWCVVCELCVSSHRLNVDWEVTEEQKGSQPNWIHNWSPLIGPTKQRTEGCFWFMCTTDFKHGSVAAAALETTVLAQYNVKTAQKLYKYYNRKMFSLCQQQCFNCLYVDSAVQDFRGYTLWWCSTGQLCYLDRRCYVFRPSLISQKLANTRKMKFKRKHFHHRQCFGTFLPFSHRPVHVLEWKYVIQSQLARVFNDVYHDVCFAAGPDPPADWIK